MTNKLDNKGFGIVGVVMILVVLAVIGFGGRALYHHEHKAKSVATGKATASNVGQAKSSTKPVDPYAGWQTYTDTGYSLASGISIKYPTDWKVNVGDSKAFAWEIVQQVAPQSSIDVRDAYLPASTTAQQEWDNCPSADACGPAPGDTKLEGNTSTTNGLETYSVKMQGSTGIYYATVIKANKTTANGTAFVEFILGSTDAATVNTYKQILASADFSN